MTSKNFLTIDNKVLLISACHFFISIFFEKRFFDFYTFSSLPAFVFKILIIVFFWAAVFYLFGFYRRNLRQFYITLGYLVFSLCVLLLIWPGNWGVDEYYILLATKILKTYAWQHVLSSFFYYIGFSIFPSPIFIVLFQVVFISLIVGYCVNAVFLLNQQRCISIVAVLPFILIPVINENYLTYRATLLGYLILFFIVFISYNGWIKKSISNKQIVGLALIGAFISTWRGETVYLIFLAPLFFIYAFKKTLTLKSKSIFISIFALCSIAVIVYQDQSWSSPELKSANQLSLYASPLRALVLHAQQDGEEALVGEIDSMINVNYFNRYATGNEAFWAEGFTRSQFFEDPSKLFNAYIKLVKTYPGVFLVERWDLLVRTIDNPISNARAVFEGPKFTIMDEDPLTHYINQNVRYYTMTFLELRNFPILKAMLYFPLPPFIILLYLFFYWFYKKNYLFALACFFTLPAFVLVFFSAPVPYFMYYFSIYLCGYFFLVSSLVISIGNRELLRKK